jgi:dihydrofolate reductase
MLLAYDSFIRSLSRELSLDDLSTIKRPIISGANGSTPAMEQPGNFILAHGGAGFARRLVASGLIDEYRLVIHPVVLGRGQPLFSGLRSPVDLRLISATAFGSGVVAAIYQPA